MSVTFIFCIALTKLEGVMGEDDLSIDILDENPKGLGSTVDLLVPPEVGNDREVHTEKRAGDRLDLCLQPGLRVSQMLR